MRIAALAHEAGLPAGVLNVVPGSARRRAPRWRRIRAWITSRSPALPRWADRSPGGGRVDLPVTLELGGKSPNIVFADADLERAAPPVVNSILQNAGQTCSAGSRLLVERSVQARLVEALRERFAAVRIGRGIDDPDLGPLISATQLERVRGYVDRGRSEARLVAGGALAR